MSHFQLRAFHAVASEGSFTKAASALNVTQPTLGELAGRRLVLREVGSTTRRIFETTMARHGLALGEVLEINSREAVREAVAAGLGIGIVSENEFVSTPRLKALPFADIELPNVEYLVCLDERRGLRLVRAFLDVAREFVEPPDGDS